MRHASILLTVTASLLLCMSGCSRQQSDWEKTRTANSPDAYELFLKKYPKGEFAPQAQARLKELYEERDWQKARDSDTLEAYQGFLKQYPEGRYTEEARIRVENFTLAAAPPAGTANGSETGADTDASAPAGPAAAPAVPPPARPARQAPSAPATPAAPHTSVHKAAVDAPAGGSHQIQLGAFKASGGAHHHWAELDKKYPKLLAGLAPTVAPTSGSGGTLYRLQVVHLSEKRAAEICKELRAHSQACVLVRAHHA